MGTLADGEEVTVKREERRCDGATVRECEGSLRGCESPSVLRLKTRSASVTRASCAEPSRVALDHLGAAPDRRAVAPDRRTVAPDRRTVAPDRRAVAPDRRAVAPDRRAVAPDRRAIAPDRRAVAPDRRAVAPDRRAVAPDRRAVAPDRRAVAPDRRTVAPSFRRTVFPSHCASLGVAIADQRNRCPRARSVSASERRREASRPLDARASPSTCVVSVSSSVSVASAPR